MKKAFGCASLTLVLVGCGQHTVSSESAIAAALTEYLDKNGDVCLGLINQWPADVTQNDIKMQAYMPSGIAGRMSALEAAGLVSQSVVPGKGATIRYSKTEQGSKSGSKGKDICFARQALDKIQKTEEISTKEVNVTYTYKLLGLEEWAKQSAMQKTFPIIKKVIDDAGHANQVRAVSLINDKWKARD